MGFAVYDGGSYSEASTGDLLGAVCVTWLLQLKVAGSSSAVRPCKGFEPVIRYPHYGPLRALTLLPWVLSTSQTMIVP